MNAPSDFNEQVIERTRKWITEVVIKCNFCPFASREVKRGSIRYAVVAHTGRKESLASLLEECRVLDADSTIETTMLIFSHGFNSFKDYLDLVGKAEAQLRHTGYEGVYQLASFHPDYFFAGEPMDDAANFTNRSIYPMIHLLREASVEKAVSIYPHPEQIPDNNIKFAREKGLAYMKMLRDSCF